MLIADMDALAAYLSDVQARRETRVDCELTPALSARMNNAELVEALILGLPMAQGIKHRIVRARGRGVVLTAKVHYRDGVRMVDGGSLTSAEFAALEIARAVADKALRLDGEETRFRYVYDWVCRNIRYAHTMPGQKGYERLVCASGALLDGQANCQGFADALYLLCSLCGIECGYRCGRGEKQLHVWNVVRLDGEWRKADASKGAREPC